MRSALAVLAAVLLLSGCGVGPQSRPEKVDIPTMPTVQAGTDGGSGEQQVQIYLVRGARLEPVRRSSHESGIDTSLALLAAGPTRTEVLVGGLRTAVPPQSFVPGTPAAGNEVVTVTVTREFTEISGLSQLLAVAQVVWTVTEDPSIRRVRFASEASPLEVPTDAGLTDQSVSREDYRTAAPTGQAASPTAPGPTDAASPTDAPASPASPSSDPGTSAPATPAPVDGREVPTTRGPGTEPP